MKDKFILKGKKLVAVDSMTWANWFENSKKERIVKQQSLPNGRWISTVFLGINHNFGEGRPLLFETMVFKNKENMNELDVARYATYEEAEYGHKEMVKKWKNIK